MLKNLDMLLRGLAGRENRVAELQSVLTACQALGPDNGGPGELEKIRCITDWLKACSVTDWTPRTLACLRGCAPTWWRACRAKAAAPSGCSAIRM